MSSPAETEGASPEIGGTEDLVTLVNLPMIKNCMEQLGYRVGETADAEGIADGVEGVWNNVKISFNLGDGNVWLAMVSHWDPPTEVNSLTSNEQVLLLQEAANDWNRQYLQPVASPHRGNGKVSIRLDYVVYISAGISKRQLRKHVMRGIGVILQAHETLPKLFPPIL